MTFTPERAIEISIKICRDKAMDLRSRGRADEAAGADECAEDLSSRLGLIQLADSWQRNGGTVDVITINPEAIKP